MTLNPGQTLLHYRIAEKIGEGGMGEVYRAQDGKLARDVAIKVLPGGLAEDPTRLMRFQREAQVLASLNHPNIAAIYGLEEVEGLRFLVLELIEGLDLAERLKQGPVPVEQALDIARQMAEALEAAHEQGIVHRDLKPANVRLTPDGKVKVLDFGLAKALEAEPGRADSSRSPTMTSVATRAGVLMGTAAYMSPEQARGNDVDKRTDIWAFGCVLLELLSGRNVFCENTISDTLASVLRSEPDWKDLPGDVPPALRRLLRRCLNKDPLKRLRDMGEARIAIDEILSGTKDDEGLPTAPAPAPVRRGRLALIVLGAVLVTAVITTAIVKRRSPTTGGDHVRRFDVVSGPFRANADTPPALSPDGQKILFGRDGRLWVRRLDQLEPQPLDGTDGATEPAWSPDSESIAFCADNDLKSVSIRGGSTTTLALGIGTIAGNRSITWGPDGRIAFTTAAGQLAEASVRGGDFRTILSPTEGSEQDFHEASFLPDGSIVFVVHREDGPDTLAVLTGNTSKTVIQIDSAALSDPIYSPTGHIVFRRGRTKTGLWAVPFSLERLEITGEPFLVTPNGSLPSAAKDGTLLYVTDASSSQFHLSWVDRKGVVDVEPASLPMAGIRSPALSPDGTRVAVMGRDSEEDNIWVYDIVRKTRTRLTFGTNDWDPVWTPDGEKIVFWDGETRALSIKAADGTGEMERLVTQELSDSGYPSISPDGKWMAFWAKPTPTTQDVWYLPLDGDRTPVPMLNSSFAESDPRISPDGNFLAYVSDESGKPQVYLTRFPSGNGKWQVSVEGGTYPVWSPLGGELFFLNRSLLEQVDVVTEPGVQLGTPRTLFDAANAGVDTIGEARFEVSRDAQRFLMVQAVHEEAITPHLVINYDWLSQFRDSE